MSVIIYISICLGLIYLYFFIGFLFNKKEITLINYFNTLFDVYRRTKLRKVWGVLLFTFMYSIGIIYLVFIKMAWYPAKCIRTVMKFVFYNKNLKT